MRDNRERLEDIIEAINRIEKYATKGKKEFQNNELIQNWFISNLQIIGEAVNKLDYELKENNPDIPFKEIIGMRNILVHGYFDIDLNIVWNVIENELTPFKNKIIELIKTQP